MDIKQREKNMRRAFELRDELFELANSFAGDEYGSVACTLHESCNLIARAGARFKPAILLPKNFPPYRKENFAE